MNHKTFKHCPNCTSEKIIFSEDKKFHCPVCHFVYYQNVAGAVAVILHSGAEILFTLRNEEPSKGKLDLAGGFTDPNESAEQTVKRELMEELRIDINTEELEYVGSEPNIYHYLDVKYYTLDLYFTYEIQKVTMDYNLNEIQELKWININDLDINDLAFESHKKFFKENKKKLLW